MTATLIPFLAGLLLGCAASGTVYLYLLRSRPYRKLNNRVVILLGQLLVLISVGGGLFLLLFICERLEIPRRSTPFYAAIDAYIVCSASVVFLAFRAEIRWRKSVGLDRKTQ
ncbi:MAG: hypothetical protein WAK48_30470 [Candidatus Acidiferrum sp.]|jgi:hypothetical protein